jgi:hypothetical protein
MMQQSPLLLLSVLFLLFSNSLSQGCELVLDNAANEITVDEDGLTIKWKVSTADETIDIFLSTARLDAGTAWIAFGLSESGGMVGADIFSVEFSDSDTSGGGTTSLVDRYVPWAAAPLESSPLPYPVTDTHQDWELICSENSANRTTAVVRRKWNTGDEQDRAIVAGSNAVIYAWDKGGLGYHAANRGSLSLDFLATGEEAAAPGSVFLPPSDADASFVAGFSPGYALKGITTQYVCQVIDVGTTLRHVVAVEQVYTTTSTAPFVHHVLVHACGNDLNALHKMNLYEGSAMPCQMTSSTVKGNSPVGMGACTSILYGGAKGGDPFVLPEEAGLLLGQEVRYIVVETHLDNPSHATGGTVTDVVKFHTTSTLRPNHAGAMVVGDPAIFLTTVPGPQSSVHFETTCPSECTETFASERHVFSSFLHMHQVDTS